MLRVQLDENRGVAILEPNGELSKEDFDSASRLIDPYLETNKVLKGIVIHVQSFPGWESFSSLVAHLKFVREHHKKIARIAISTDSPIAGVAENLASHFLNAEIKGYAFSDFEMARHWASGETA